MAKRESFFAWAICGLGALFYCYEYFLRMSPSVMTHDLMQSLNVNAAALGNLAAFYYYAYTPMQLPVGLLMDRYGPRRLLAGAALICALGAYLFTNTHLGVAQTGRFLVGFGSAFAFVGVLKLATIWLPPNRFALIAGATTTLGMLGGMFGDFLLAPLVSSLGWRTTTYYSAVGGIILALMIWFFIPFRKETDTQQLACTFNQLFIQLISLFKNSQMWLVGFVGFGLYLSLSIFAELWGIPYLERAYNLSSATAAGMISSVFLGWAIGSPLIGWLSDRIRNRRVPMLMCSVAALITIMIVLYLPGVAKNNLYCWLLAFGVFTSAEIIVFPIARELSPSHLAGTAIAMTNTLIMLGGVLFQPLIGFFLDLLSSNRGSPVNLNNLSNFSGHDFQLALAILPVSLVCVIVAIFFIKETYAGEAPV